jgi:hypothetical protein
MELRQTTLFLIELNALLFPFLAVLLRMTIGEVSSLQDAHPWIPVGDLVLVGGGFSMIFLIGSLILLVQVVVRTAGYGVATPLGLALVFLLVSLVLFGLITVVFLWGVLVADVA